MEIYVLTFTGAIQLFTSREAALKSMAKDWRDIQLVREERYSDGKLFYAVYKHDGNRECRLERMRVIA